MGSRIHILNTSKLAFSLHINGEFEMCKVLKCLLICFGFALEIPATIFDQLPPVWCPHVCSGARDLTMECECD